MGWGPRGSLRGGVRGQQEAQTRLEEEGWGVGGGGGHWEETEAQEVPCWRDRTFQL